MPTLTDIAAGASFRLPEISINPGICTGLVELESASHTDLSKFFICGIVGAKQCVRIVFIGHDIEGDADSSGLMVDRDVLVERCMKLLRLALPKFAGCLDEGVEC